MAISHIPRSVGHNFAPEYQISSVPYIVDFSSATSIFLITSKNASKGVPDNTIVGEATAADGVVTMTNPNVALTDVFNDNGAGGGVAGDNQIHEDERTADNLKDADFESIEVKVVQLPKISRWIQVLPSGGAIQLGFSKADIAKDKFIEYASDSYPLELRCTNLYFKAANGKVLAGLTSIDRSEFTEVVEKFLGD